MPTAAATFRMLTPSAPFSVSSQLAAAVMRSLVLTSVMKRVNRKCLYAV
jgi:hypothetical protein